MDRRRLLKSVAGLTLAGALGCADPPLSDTIDVRRRGVAGDDATDDTAAINRLIVETSAKGGGTLYFPVGIYFCRYTIHLRDHVHLRLAAGAVIKAAPSGDYDPAERNAYGNYQDFGHSHWRNSLICGIGVRDVVISGPGRISGMGLSPQEWRMTDGTQSALVPGVADKVLSLKNCRDIVLKDFALDGTAHFAILATGVDNLQIRGLMVDAARDGIDLDSCWGAEITDCVVNAPYDDGICIKASFALGTARGSKHIRVRRCRIFGGFEVGTLRDGGGKRLAAGLGGKGRYKLGTESNGPFEDIVFEDCSVEDGLGLLLASVDGGRMAGVTVRNFTLHNTSNAPVFVWLGDRLRGPPGISVGAIEDVKISGLRCYGYDNSEPIIVSGLLTRPIAGFTLEDAYLLERGGGSREETFIIPPTRAQRYPETSLLGERLPAQGLFARYVKDLRLTDVRFDSVIPDRRPFVWLGGVTGKSFAGIGVPHGAAAPLVYHATEVEATR